jgi:diketogulonate reductase-like aldo/keto reductase
MWSRRGFLGAVAASLPAIAYAQKPMTDLLTRPVPSTGEKLPVVGIGSWQTFDTDDIAPITPVIERFLALGGRVIDSSPMYGKSEASIGKMLAALRKANPALPVPFLATKVWTRGKGEGIAQMKRSLQRMGTTKLDLMQIHNLVDWKTHLATLRAWKAEGTIRYIGITHYQHGEFGAMEKIIEKEKIDFVQLPYSVAERGAEKRLLPAAAAAGVAVLVMEPFAKGELFTRVKGKALPAVAKELGATSWAQLFLKFIVGHPAVTAPIPATSKLVHLEDNLGALRGAMPTEAQRKAIAAAI